MCDSLKLDERDDPRWPLVPNATRCAGTPGVGHAVVVGVDQLVDVDQVGGFGGLSGSVVHGAISPQRRSASRVDRIGWHA
jgi:hypothetical protein